MANLERLRARGNMGARTPQTQSGSRENERATPAPMSRPQGERAPSRPRRGARVANGAPGSTPGAGARKAQRGQRTRTARTAERTPTRPDNDHGKQLLKTQRYDHKRGTGVRQLRTRSRPRGARSGQARTAQSANGCSKRDGANQTRQARDATFRSAKSARTGKQPKRNAKRAGARGQGSPRRTQSGSRTRRAGGSAATPTASRGQKLNAELDERAPRA